MINDADDSGLDVTVVTISAVRTQNDFSPTFILKYFKKNRCFFFLKLFLYTTFCTDL